MQTGPVARTLTPGATVCEKTQGFVRLLSSKNDLDTAFEAAIPMQNASLDEQTQWHSALHIDAGGFLSGKTHGFVRFLSSKNHLDKAFEAAIPMQNANLGTKHNGAAHEVFQRQPLHSADNEKRLSAAPSQTGPVEGSKQPFQCIVVVTRCSDFVLLGFCIVVTM